MAAADITSPTYADLAKNVDPGWKENLPLIELLHIKHGLMSVIPAHEGNLATGHRALVRTGLATPAWRMFGRGTPASTTREAQVDFQCAILKSIPEVDTELLKIAPNREQFILSRVAGHIEGMMQEAGSTAWYGTAASPEEFVGLSAMYASTTAANGRNVLKAGGTDQADSASIWFLDLGPEIFATYPRGSTAGISRAGEGVWWSENYGGTGLRALVHRLELSLGIGVVVTDWRKAVRICNIDVSALVAETNDADLLKLGTKAKHRLNANPTQGRRVCVMHSSIAEYLEHQMNDRMAVGGGVTVKNVDGMDVTHFCGAPIVIDDNLVLTETAVS